MPEPKSIGPQEVRRKLSAGSGTLLVCVYPKAKYDQSHLEGAISMDDLASRLPSLPKEAEIVFY